MLDITVPATLSNLGPGYDTLGLAVSILNRFRFERATDWRVDGETVDPDAQLTLATARRAARAFGVDLPGLSVVQDERVPRSRGLGSSATARVAGLTAALGMAGREIPLSDRLAFLTEEEGHPDNVVPAVVGGLALVDVTGGRISHLRLPPPKLVVALCVPDREVSTAEARRILPETVSRDDAVFNLRRLGFLLVGLIQGLDDAVELGVDDRLHQPWRGPLIGPSGEALQGAKQAGALGAFISGSGSTLAALCTSDEVAEAAARAMEAPFRAEGTPCAQHVVRPMARGVLASG